MSLTIPCVDLFCIHVFYKTPNGCLKLDKPVLLGHPCHLLNPVALEGLFYQWDLGVLVDQPHAFHAFP